MINSEEEPVVDVEFVNHRAEDSEQRQTACSYSSRSLCTAAWSEMLPPKPAPFVMNSNNILVLPDKVALA